MLALSCLGILGMPLAPRQGDLSGAAAASGSEAVVTASVAETRDDPPVAPLPADRLQRSSLTEAPQPPPAGATASALVLAGEARPLAGLFGLGVRTIVLDPGHGGIDPGAIGARRTREKDLTLDVARRLAALLRRQPGLRVLMTREGDETVPLARRVEIANAAAADLFVSIHANALRDARANAVETYWFGAPADPETWRLAEQENSDSGMAIGAFKLLIDKLGDTLKQQESLALARSVQANLLEGVMHRPQAPDAGVKVAPFVVLLGVEAPGVLAEITCISNAAEALRLATPEYRDEIAAALERGIVAYVGTRNPRAYGATEDEPSSSEGANGGEGDG